MRKIIIILAGIVFCAGCYIPHPSNRVGVRTLRPVERWEKVCTEKVLASGEKVKHCKWVRSR